MAKLMLVEDDNNLREIYEARLQAEGYTIVTARDGEEALVVAKAEKPDLIISDVMMPKISGFEMLDILRNTEGMQAVKVIMLTALGQSDDQQRADKLGADRYLVKSQVTLEDIVKTTHDLLSDAGGAGAAPAAPAPEPAPEPTASDPATSIPVAVEPPAASPAPATPAATASDDAEPAKDEAAGVEAHIEDFVAGASEDPTTPAKAPDAGGGASQTADDKLMADAVNNLVASTPPADQATTETPPAPEPTTPEKKPATTGGNKVIEPLDSKPKRDINELLAEEEAKEKSATKAEPASPNKPDEKSVDPNSIAL